jgi:hypothetical protein
MNTGLMVTRPILRPSVQACSIVASPSPITGIGTADRASARPGSLEVTDHKRVISPLLGGERVGDHLCRATELGDRVQVSVARPDAEHIHLQDPGAASHLS